MIVVLIYGRGSAIIMRGGVDRTRAKFGSDCGGRTCERYVLDFLCWLMIPGGSGGGMCVYLVGRGAVQLRFRLVSAYGRRDSEYVSRGTFTLYIINLRSKYSHPTPNVVKR